MKSITAWLKTKDKKSLVYLFVVLMAGVLMMMVNRRPTLTENVNNLIAPVIETEESINEPEQDFKTEREMEKRLEEAFSMVEDVGKVRVLLSFTPDKETVFAADANINESYSREADAQGGTRETRSTHRQDKTITITDRAGVDRPLVLREIEPKIAGVVIIAEGGDCVFVKDALTKAACTVLGIEANKVHVLKMK